MKPTLAELKAMSIKVQDGRYHALQTQSGYGSYKTKWTREQQARMLREWLQRIDYLRVNVIARIKNLEEGA